jgi:transcriptional regulator with AAA-type ATPase domain
MADYTAYHWPGNIPELKRMIVQTVSAAQPGSHPECAPGPCNGAFQGKEERGVAEWFDAEDIRNYLKENVDISLKIKNLKLCF